MSGAAMLRVVTHVALVAAAALTLAACGKRGPLEPPAGVTPPKPIWQTQAPPPATPAPDAPSADPAAAQPKA